MTGRDSRYTPLKSALPRRMTMCLLEVEVTMSLYWLAPEHLLSRYIVRLLISLIAQSSFWYCTIGKDIDVRWTSSYEIHSTVHCEMSPRKHRKMCEIANR